MSPEMNDHTTPATPLDAATVILLRETPAANPFELLLMRRHAKQRFMGKAFVYPGGQLDPADCNPGLAAFASGIRAEDVKRRLNEPDLPNEKALGLLFAAVRETFEESGVLLARSISGKDIDFNNKKIRERFAEYRTLIHQHEMTLEDLAEKEGLFFKLKDLIPFAHWVTPEAERRRFDTRFFLARMPFGQEPVHDSMEMTETLWTTPGKAFSKHNAGEILLMPPTLKTIDEMACRSSVSELLSWASSTTIRTIMPQISSEGESIIIKFPHDPEYSIAELKQPPRPEEISRIVIRDGRLEAINFGDQLK